jgi:predicted transcriptional regulator
VTVDPQDHVGHVAETMMRRGLRRVPVVHDGRLVGVIAVPTSLIFWRKAPGECCRALSRANSLRDVSVRSLFNQNGQNLGSAASPESRTGG